MIALLSFLQPPEILIEFLLREPRRSIDALQHGTILITAPVGTRCLHEFERTDLTRILYVRSATEVKKGILLVDTYFCIGQIFDQFNLISLPFIAEVFQSLFAGPTITQEWIFARDDTCHTLLDVW